MDWNETLKIITAAITSIGAGAAIILAFSSWLGKVWASRILDREKNELDKELQKTKNELDILKETTLKFQNDKIITYRLAIDMIAKLLAAFDAHQLSALSKEEALLHFNEFNQQRIQVYGYLAMLAPQDVMDAQDNLIDFLLLISNGTASYEWSEVRRLAINMLNEIRKDIGIGKRPITYNGEL